MIAFSGEIDGRLSDSGSPAEKLLRAVQIFSAVQELQNDIQRAIELAAAQNHFEYLPMLIRAHSGLAHTRLQLTDQIKMLNAALDLISTGPILDGNGAGVHFTIG